MTKFLVFQGLQGAVGLRQHFGAVMREKKALEAIHKSPSAELKAAQDNLGKTVAQCAETVHRVERLEAHNSRLEASVVSNEAELKRQAEEMEELKAFKLFALDRINDLEGQVETLTV